MNKLFLCIVTFVVVSSFGQYLWLKYWIVDIARADHAQVIALLWLIFATVLTRSTSSKDADG